MLFVSSNEIKFKSPNWLFGQRKSEETGDALKVASCANAKGQEETGEDNLFDLNWLSPDDGIVEEDIFLRYLAKTSEDEASGWCRGTLLGDQDENSEIYNHYAELCQGLSIEPFENGAANVPKIGMVENMDDGTAEAEMEAALNEYNQIGSDLGIFHTCKSFSEDPSQTTRWLIGEHKICRS